MIVPEPEPPPEKRSRLDFEKLEGYDTTSEWSCMFAILTQIGVSCRGVGLGQGHGHGGNVT